MLYQLSVHVYGNFTGKEWVVSGKVSRTVLEDLFERLVPLDKRQGLKEYPETFHHSWESRRGLSHFTYNPCS